MRKTFKHLAMAALATALIAGSATTAFAFKDDSNNGPGSGKLRKYLYRRLATEILPSPRTTALPRTFL